MSGCVIETLSEITFYATNLFSQLYLARKHNWKNKLVYKHHF